jgi:hypothetical protein
MMQRLLIALLLLGAFAFAAAPQPAAAADGVCTVTLTATLVNNVPEERTARLRVLDTVNNGRIVLSAEATFALNETRTITLTGDAPARALITLNRAGMRLITFDRELTGDADACASIQVFVGDGRLNAGLDQNAAPVAAFCTRRGGVELWDIDARGQGTLAARATEQQVKTALEQARTTGVNQLIVEGLSNSLFALTTDEIQISGLTDEGRLYTFIVPGDTCALR